MKFIVKKVTSADLQAASQYYTIKSGTLAAAAAQVFWPVGATDNAAAKARTDWSFEQQIAQLQNDPTVRFMQVIDTESGEVVSLARWHDYPNGYTSFGDLDAVGIKDRNDPTTFPTGFNKDPFLSCLDSLLGARREWQGTGHCWVLTNIVTREPFRKNGAASLLLEWGLKQAKAASVPAFLEAVPDAKSLYETHGFRVVGKQTISLAPDVSFEVAWMRADP